MSEQIEPIVYDDADLEPTKVEVTLGKTKYLLIEAGEDESRKYRNFSARAIKMTDGKVSGVENPADVQAYLLSLCLYELGANGEVLRKVPESLIRGIKKGQVVKRLFDLAKKISHLDEGTKDVEPKMVDLCRKEMALLHHPDRGGDEQFYKGTNAALDWLKAHVKEPVSDEQYAKNSPPPTTGTTT